MKNFTKLILFLLTCWVTGIVAQPANDNCGTADVVGALPWTSAAYDVTLATATGDPAAPTCQIDVARSIWFTFTPASTGNYYLSTCQSDAAGNTLPDIILGVYTSAGGCAGPFTQVVCDDDGCTTLNFQSLIPSANLTAGTTYYIVAWQYCFGCSAPSVGAESIQLYVKQNTAPDCATLNTPANGATGVAVNTPLTWTPAGTGGTPTGYKVYLGTVNPPVTLVSTVTAPTTTYTPSGQLPSTTYYWYIVPTNGVGDAVGCNSTIYSYTTASGPTCPSGLGAGTVNIGSLPYTATALTNCGNGNNITSANSTVCGSTNYYGGEDKTFIFTPSTSGVYNITLTTTSTYTGLMLYNGCPFTGGGTCVGNAQSSTGNKALAATLTAGVTYYLVVDSWPSPSCHPSFDLSIVAAPPPPMNDVICGATSLSVSAGLTCTTLLTNQSTQNSTAGATACIGSGADDDIWYSFVATGTSHIITLTNSGAGSTDRVHQVYSSSDNTCTGTLTSISCSDPESSTLTGLTIGNTYFIRVHSYATSGFATFDICVTTVVPPACTTNTAPANGATGVALLPTLTWTAAAGATSYDIYFVGTLPLAWVNPVNTVSTSYTLLIANTLAANTTYTWYITPRNASGPAVGCNSNTTTFTTAAPATTFSGTGNWSDPARWSAGVPGCTSPVTIAAAAVCAVDIAAVAGNVTIASTGRLNVAANSLTMGCSNDGGNRALSVSGTLSISGGDVMVNGNVALASSSTFLMSAGNLIIDPNSGVSGSSVASGTAVFAIGSSSTAVTTTVTGGTILINDPPFSGGGFSVVMNTNTSSNWSGSTIQFGGSTNTHPTTATNGFQVDCYVNSGRLMFGNVIVNGGDVSKRVTDISFGINAANTLTVNSGSELRLNTTLSSFAGNIVNNGIITNTGGMSLQSLTGSTAAASPNIQTITGGGVWRNLTSSPTANMNSLVVNNGSGTAIVLPSNMITGVGTGSVSGTLTLTAGKLDVSLGNLTVGISAAATGTISGGSATAYVIGELRKWRSNTTGAQLFPVGSVLTYYPATVNFTGAPSAGGTNNVQFITGDPGSAGLPAADPSGTNPNCFTACTTGYWQIDAGNGLTGGTYSLDLTATAFPCVATLANVRILKRPTAGGNWTFNGLHGTNVATNVIKRTGLTGFSQFGIAQGTNTPLPIELRSFTGKALASSNMLTWTTATEKGVSSHIIERSADGYSNWTEVGATPSKGDAQFDQSYSLEDRKPLAKSFYRLRSVDRDGSEQLSNVISLTRQNNVFGVIAAYPNPATEMLNIEFNAIEEGTVTARITDMTGRLVAQQQIGTEKGSNLLPLQLGQLSAGTYFVTLSNSSAVSEPVRFVKQ